MMNATSADVFKAVEELELLISRIIKLPIPHEMANNDTRELALSMGDLANEVTDWLDTYEHLR